MYNRGGYSGFAFGKDKKLAGKRGGIGTGRVEVLSTSADGKAIGRVAINPLTVVAHSTKGNIRLVDLMGIKPDANGRYWYQLIGYTDSNGVAQFPGIAFIDRLNGSAGNNPHIAALNATANWFTWNELERSIKLGTNRILREHQNFNAALLPGQLGPRLKQAGFHQKMRTGYLMNLVDPFMTVDNSLRRNQWDLTNALKYNQYAEIRTQGLKEWGEGGQSQAYVGNTLTSYYQIIDTDSDALKIIQLQLLHTATNALRSEVIFGLKSPHTTHQIGAIPAGPEYNRFTKYQRMVAPNPAELLEDMNSLAKLSSISATYSDQAALKNAMKKTIREAMVGKYFSKAWLGEAVRAEAILKAVPKYLLDTFGNSEEVVENVRVIEKALQDPATRADFATRINQGLKNSRWRTGSETILKVKGGVADLLGKPEFENMLLNIAWDMRDKTVRFLNSADSIPIEERLSIAAELSILSPEERLRYALAHNPLTLRRGNAGISDKVRQGIDISKAFDGNGKLILNDKTKLGITLFERLTDQTFLDPTTGQYRSILQIDKVNAKYTGGKPGLLVTMNLPTIDPETGQLGLKSNPLAGKIGLSVGEIEKSIYIPDMAGKVESIDLLIYRLSEAAADAGLTLSHLENLGKLTGEYSLENLRKGNTRVVNELAEAGNVTPQNIIAMARSGKSEHIKMLESFKVTAEMNRAGRTGASTGFQDVMRVIKKAAAPMGLEAKTRRDWGGRQRIVGDSQARILSNITLLSTFREAADPDVQADILTKMSKESGHSFIAGPKMSDTVDYLFKAHKSDIVGDWIGPRGLREGSLYAPHRIGKQIPYSHTSLELRGARIALFDTQFTDDELNAVRGFFADNDPLKPTRLDVGLLYATRQGANLVRDTILSELDPNSYSEIQIGEFTKELSFNNPVTGEKEKIYVRADFKEPDYVRLIHSNTGNVRAVPTVGDLGDTYSVGADGSKRDVHFLYSVGEAKDKGATAHMVQLGLLQEGQIDTLMEMHRLAKDGGEEARAKFANMYRGIMNRGIEVTMNDSENTVRKFNSLDVLQTLYARNLETDMKQHKLTSWMQLRDVIGEDLLSPEELAEVEATSMLRGQEGLNRINDIAFGMKKYLERGNIGVHQNLIDEESILDLFQRGSGLGGSLAEQFAFSEQEVKYRNALGNAMATYGIAGIENPLAQHEAEIILGLEEERLNQQIRQIGHSQAMSAATDLMGSLGKGRVGVNLADFVSRMLFS